MSPLAAQRVLITVAPALLISALLVTLLWGKEGLNTRGQLRFELQTANTELAGLERDNQRLLRDLKLMEEDPVVLERMVAEELLWAAEDTTLYRFEDEE
ncbi:MAG: septum formation initiator family protein [Proteobacteria bacterium]|nr:septum formation initiator family protein [Pseudomonadota bacterium]